MAVTKRELLPELTSEYENLEEYFDSELKKPENVERLKKYGAVAIPVYNKVSSRNFSPRIDVIKRAVEKYEEKDTSWHITIDGYTEFVLVIFR